MNINNPEELKKYFEEFKELVKNEEADKAMHMLEELLKSIEEQVKVRRAGSIDARGNISISEPQDNCEHIYMSLNHVMEYYIYAFYFKPDCDVVLSELPYGEYYRSYGDLCVKSGRYKAGIEAYSNAICWNPVDLDAILGLAECYKYLNMLKRYMIVTKEAVQALLHKSNQWPDITEIWDFIIFLHTSRKWQEPVIYIAIFITKTDNADAELSYIEQALNQETPKLSVKEMQKMFDDEGIEPGPSSDTIGVIYRVGQIMMESQDYRLAKDCFSIVYDITQEEQLEKLLEELENV